MGDVTAMRARRRAIRSRTVTSAETYESTPGDIPNKRGWGKRVYAIAFDLDQEMLQTHYHNASYKNGYSDIQRVLDKYGFTRQQGSVYFGNDKVDPVICVLAVQDLSKSFQWFKAAVIDIRMLRIEENNDLMPAVGDLELPLESPTVFATSSGSS